MLRLLAQMAISLLANAIGLIAASLLLSGFSLDGVSFLIATVIFSLATLILGPLVLKIALKNATFLVGGIALVTTFIGLVITDVVSDGISITGLSTWIVATLIIWVFSIIANLVLPLLLFKKVLNKSASK